ncbi:MAG: alpha/beta hydrolase [Proteobacteria bacterium]|nr:alpha/beta hydrolase [Pseudomonadota bacterium]
MRRQMILALTALAATSFAAGRAFAGASPEGSCRAAPKGMVVDTPAGAKIAVRTVGHGRPILLIPSMGRGRADFDDLAERLARRGFMSLLPEPRGVNGSTGPAPATLFDLADDAASVTGTLCSGPVGVVGHAFGNRVARAFATRHPEMVSKVALLAGGGEVPIPPDIQEALDGSTAQGRKPDAERLKDLQVAFFAKGHDPAVWLKGWYPGVAAAQMVTVRATPAKTWWTAGGAPILLIQAAEDPIAPAGNADALRRDVGSKLTLITLRHASHAMLPEQPAAISLALARYFGAPDVQELALQRDVDAATAP